MLSFVVFAALFATPILGAPVSEQGSQYQTAYQVVSQQYQRIPTLVPEVFSVGPQVKGQVLQVPIEPSALVVPYPSKVSTVVPYPSKYVTRAEVEPIPIPKGYPIFLEYPNRYPYYQAPRFLYYLPYPSQTEGYEPQQQEQQTQAVPKSVQTYQQQVQEYGQTQVSPKTTQQQYETTQVSPKTTQQQVQQQYEKPQVSPKTTQQQVQQQQQQQQQQYEQTQVSPKTTQQQQVQTVQQQQVEPTQQQVTN